MGEIFGPAERLHAAVRRRAPRIAVSVVRDEEAGLSRVSVTYRGEGPRLIGWDGSSYTWHDGPYRGLSIGADAEEVADCVAATLGANRPH
ncbi:hypothetical protein [Actinomadura sp. 9N215]|uniref:hypothetical protein n=1 Tax=Actinomadura sp. 9N215 TaxID=3375150 RepID=UPI00378AF030